MNLDFREKYCLRNPILPIKVFQDLTDETHVSDEALSGLWQRDIVKEAMYVASPDLYHSIESWLSGDQLSSKRRESIKLAFIRYLIRMSTRCTPFGLFAGVSMGQFSHESKILLSNIEEHNRKSRLDMSFIDQLFNKINSATIENSQWLFYPNTTLYVVGDEYRFLKYSSNKKGRQYYISGIHSNELLQTILKEAENGMKREDCQNILTQAGMIMDEAKRIVHSLISNQILVSEANISLIGSDNLDRIIKTIQNQTTQDIESLDVLLKFQETIKKIDDSITSNITLKRELSDIAIKTGIEFENNHLLQTDLFYKIKSNNLKSKYAYKTKRVIEYLQSISIYKEHGNIAAFKKEFLDKYETQEMSLCHVMDLDVGIGYIQNARINNTTSFLDDIKPQFQNGNSSNQQTYSNNERIIIEAIRGFKYSNAKEIKLEELNLEKYENQHRPIDTLYCINEILNIGTEDTIHIKSLGGTNGSNILGRFAYGSNNIHEEIKEVCRIEANLHPNKILVELHHLPEARTGNVLQRTSTREYQLPYLAMPESKATQNINIGDIMISIKNNKIRLRCQKNNKEILPRLTNAHNYSLSSVPMYRFLCDLQYQNNQTAFNLPFSSYCQDHHFVPRITYNNVILSKASWNLTKWKKLYADKSLQNIINECQSKSNMPINIELRQSDNILPLNLKNQDCINILRKEFQSKANCVIQEHIPHAKFVKDKADNIYSHEFVFSFLNNKA